MGWLAAKRKGNWLFQSPPGSAGRPPRIPLAPMRISFECPNKEGETPPVQGVQIETESAGRNGQREQATLGAAARLPAMSFSLPIRDSYFIIILPWWPKNWAF